MISKKIVYLFIYFVIYKNKLRVLLLFAINFLLIPFLIKFRFIFHFQDFLIFLFLFQLIPLKANLLINFIIKDNKYHHPI